MKRKTILTFGAAATVAVIGVVAIPALACGPSEWGPSRMTQMMHGQAGGFFGGPAGPGMIRCGGFGGPGPMQSITDNPVYKSFDTDANGTVTSTELDAGITALHAKHDADGSGTLSHGEFDALFAEATRSVAERPFAMLDADGNQEIDSEELAFPAKMMARMHAIYGTGTVPNPQDN